MLPEEVKNDPEKVTEITDYLWYNFGINSDLDNDGIYGEADTSFGRFFQSILAVPSSAVNTGIDLTIDPLLYLTATGLGAQFAGPEGGTALSELYREGRKPIKEALRGFEAQVPEGS